MTTSSKRILVLGGTVFLGRAIVDAALAGGHEVTLFNRGVTNPDLYPELERLRGDRTTDLSALAGREFDAVIDVATDRPEVARRSVEALSGQVGQYLFVSSVSAYARHDTVEAQLEDATLLDPSADRDEAERFGAGKAACEAVVRARFGERATIARPGLIVGPHDPTDRFGYWPRRLAAGGRVLAPGSPDEPVQFVDVRDVGDWLVRAASSELGGVFNVTGLPMAFGELLEACRVAGTDAEIVWVASDRLLAAGVAPWTGLPLWLPVEEYAAFASVDATRALGAGLSYRPLRETVTGAREDNPVGEHSLTLAEEQRLLESRL